MHLPNVSVHWICLYISTSFSISVNGELEGFFSSFRCIRQGCSLSRYIYVVINNILSKLLNQAAVQGQFGYHPCCKEIKISHLSFADDIMVFSDRSPHSFLSILNVMRSFSAMSGHQINVSKSSLYVARRESSWWMEVASTVGISLSILLINLSLFNSAVSLSCNHVFCNECILESMKIDATCPVCKIPYHRREIRGTPHMDSLVSIYKNMEVASGVNLFVSQNNSSLLDERYTSKKANGKTRQGSRKGRTSKGKGKTTETDVDAPGPIVMKPSSQTKKRVQLLQNLSSESLTKSFDSVELAEKLKDYTENTVIRLDEPLCLNKERNLSPFFWLRDDDYDGESSSHLAKSDQLLDMPPVDVPTFSDLKDSDHEGQSRSNDQEKPNPGDMFGSEMFEWTQRPSSPEILPSPVKAKVLEIDEIDLSKSSLFNIASSKSKKCKAGSAKNTVARLSIGVSQEDYMESSAVVNNGQKEDSRGKSGTNISNDGNPDENVKAKRVTRSKGQNSRVQCDLKISKEADGKQEIKRKRSNIKSSPAHRSEFSVGNEIVGKGDSLGNSVGKAHNSFNSLLEKRTPIEKPSLKKRGRKSNGSSFPKDLPEKTQRKTLEKRRELDSNLISRKATELHGNDIHTNELNQLNDLHDSTNKKKFAVDNGNHTTQGLEKCLARNKPSSGVSALLQRCDRSSTKKSACAFCQSSEDTEASGEMSHYHKGEPIPADFDGGSKVVHVHKNCTEWAPNVYFNNRTAVNLDVELTRSRRISCSYCGVKGAALGCYNKSCKNSFHVTCAKLIPECRWDNENFVMLCPLDASSKLPCEETSPKERKCKRTPKRPLHSQPNQVSENSDISELQTKPFHSSPKKLVLCCSGLTVEEKSVVSEFAELSGVTISRKWEPSVTHVIASINENGACKRTLKFMMGILEGKWILSIDWIKTCMKSTKYVSEEPYEITMDVHGIQKGPYVGRQRALNKKPKNFGGRKFYIMGDFEVAYKGYLQDLIVAAGGTILRRRPISNRNDASTIIVFSLESCKNKSLTQIRCDAESLAKSSGARAASSSWVLDSIAGCQILDLV